jgi:CheY-specific phosphatase CheX
MLDIPDHHGLTDLFNNVTTSMLCMDCAVANDLPADPKEYHSTAVLPILGDGGFTLAVSSDLQGCTVLSAAMFAVDATEVDSEMINDTMAELANMAAGQLKGRLSLGNSLGLPVNLPGKDFADKSANSENGWSHYPMRAGKAVVLLSITTQTSVAEEYIGS